MRDNVQVPIRYVLVSLVAHAWRSATLRPDDSVVPGTGSGNRVLPPHMVNAATSSLVVARGARLNVSSPGVTGVTSTDHAVLSVSQPYDDGSARFNAGARAEAQGTATLVVRGAADRELYRVAVTVTGAARPNTEGPGPR